MTVDTTRVVIVGGGYAGLASALFLSHQGVPCVLVDRHYQISLLGRARGINPRTMEIYRALGLAEAVKEAGKPFDEDAGVARCETLTGPWQWIWGDEQPRTMPELTSGEFGLADQSAVEPILAGAARDAGADLRFNTQCVSVEQDADGVTVVTEDRATGERRTIRGDYLIAADGYRGGIREQLGIERPGLGVLRSFVSFVFRADLSGIIKQRALFWIVGNSGAFASHALPDHWGIGVTYDPEHETPDDYPAERCAELAKAMIGADVPVEVIDRAAWVEAVGVAERYRAGRIFLAGDAAHVWPAAQAMGANSAVQDAHNLAWKLAAVINGGAGESLLDTYEAERRPVALELADLTVASQRARFGPNPQDDPVDPVLVILGQRYRSTAMVGAEHEGVFGDTVEQHARPGTRAPHVWFDRDGARIGVHDLFHDGFVLLSESPEWIGRAADADVRAYRIGADLTDVEDVWQRRYGLPSDAAILIRPDGYVAWRSDGPVEDLPAALSAILS